MQYTFIIRPLLSPMQAVIFSAVTVFTTQIHVQPCDFGVNPPACRCMLIDVNSRVYTVFCMNVCVPQREREKETRVER